MLCGSGVHTSSNLKKLHSVCFNEKREKTKLLDDLYKGGFRPCDLCSILSGSADSLKKFHNFCFIGETKKYLYHFLNKEGVLQQVIYLGYYTEQKLIFVLL